MTPEQEKDAARLQRYIEREQLCSVMNNTKWREAAQVLQDIPGFVVRFRVKDVRGPEPPADYWDGSFPWHVPQPFQNIEWLDINPAVRVPHSHFATDDIEDFTEQITSALRAESIPFVLHGGVIRIWGYVRPNTKG